MGSTMPKKLPRTPAEREERNIRFSRLWQAKGGPYSGSSWLSYMGVKYGTSYRSYEVCLELSEQMPEEFLRWKALRRMGLVK